MHNLPFNRKSRSHYISWNGKRYRPIATFPQKYHNDFVFLYKSNYMHYIDTFLIAGGPPFHTARSNDAFYGRIGWLPHKEYLTQAAGQEVTNA